MEASQDDSTGFTITETKRRIAELTAKGASADAVVPALFPSGIAIPKESEQWDYKTEFPEDRLGMGKVVRAIVAMHNTYGGYLIFGVTERKQDQVFDAIGCGADQIDIAALRDSVRYYTGKAIELTHSEYAFTRGETVVPITVVHVPKRPPPDAPTEFCRNGPGDQKNRSLFLTDSIYYRRLDECVQVTSNDDYVFVLGEREIVDIDIGTGISASRRPLDNNLPAQGEIYQEFIGRSDALNELWRWLAQEFKYAKVLAGEGGIGKSSIAYRFASEIARRHAGGFDKVLWLSAKSKQFVPIDNEYREKYLIDFEDHESALRAIGRNVGLLEEEVEDASTKQLVRVLQGALSELPVFVVLDDLDSLEPEAQKQVMASAQFLGSTSSRFLLTTRRNFSFPQDDTVTVGGFSDNEFDQFVTSVSGRFGVSIDPKYLDKLRKISAGSPLLTESVLRLVHLGVPVSKAIDEWQGSSGEVARDAVLRREIEQLTEESKRTLLCTAYLGECSFTELSLITRYGPEQLRQCIQELENLYLLDAPNITAEERRFAVSSTARLLAIQSSTSLAINPRSIEQAVRQLRSGTSRTGGKGDLKAIGAVVNQAIAHLKSGETSKARTTVDAAGSKKAIAENRDFLLLCGRVALAEGDLPNAKRHLQQAYRRGCRVPEYYELTWEAERESGNAPGIVDIAEVALENKRKPKSEWLCRAAYGWTIIAKTRLQASEFQDSVRAYSRASEMLRQALECGDRSDAWELIEASRQLHERVLDLINVHMPHDDNLLYSSAMSFYQRMDRRPVIFAAMLSATEDLLGRSSTNLTVLWRRLSELNQIFKDDTKLQSKPGLGKRLDKINSAAADVGGTTT